MRFGLLAGLLIWLQMISSVYYGAFLGVIVAALAGLLVASKPPQARGAVLPLAVCAFVAAALTLPYTVPYIANARELGPRDPGEIATFSASLDSYIRRPSRTGSGAGPPSSLAATSSICSPVWPRSACPSLPGASPDGKCGSRHAGGPGRRSVPGV